jgi:hypothetical protein
MRLLLTALLATLLTSPAVAEDGRFVIKMYSVDLASSADQPIFALYHQWVHVFTNIIQARVHSALSDARNQPDGKYLDDFKLDLEDETSQLTFSKKKSEWETYNFLQLIEGVPYGMAPNGIRWNASIYVGTLGAKVGNILGQKFLDQFEIDGPLTLGTHGLTEDTIIFVTMYLLAENAIETHKSSGVVCALLTNAMNEQGNLYHGGIMISDLTDSENKIVGMVSRALAQLLQEQSCGNVLNVN